MKKIFLALLICVSGFSSFADHLKGGWIYYEYLGVGSSPNTSKYKITVKQYIRCGTLDQGQIDQDVSMGIFDGASNQLIQTETIPLAGTDFEQKSDFNCITNPPPATTVCYRVDKYEETIDLPNNIGGYILGVQRCCRITNIINVPSFNDIGLTYTNKIPGIINGQSFRNNSSPVFSQKDTALLCHNTSFTFDFSATDADGDSLSYFFITGLLGGNSTLAGSKPTTPTLPPPPYYSNAVVTYSPGYSGTSPLGNGVTINPATGIISGVAPNTIGTYIVAVAVNEYRAGILIGTTRKEIHVDVADCNLIAASPLCSTCNIVTTPASISTPLYFTSCNSFTTTFVNANNSSLINSYYWDFGVASQKNDTSTLANPTFTYPDTGTYTLTLILNRGQPCFDSTTTQVRIYPGFFPGFTTAGQCKNTQIQFTDISTTKYGVVNAWSWNFGDATTLADTSHTQNPRYSFGSAGNYDVTFFVSNSKGCADTIIKTITITDKPSLAVTNDTLICAIDTLQLNAIGNGSVFWTPNYNINNQNNPAPLVSPKVPTKYYVTLTDPFGCKASDSVFVNVVQSVTLDGGADTSICQGDIIQLNPSGNALNYVWTPSSPLNNNTLKNPLARPLVTTTFYVMGSIGKCQAKDSVKIKVTPYPAAVAKLDTAICFGDIIQLHASGGSSYSWSPPFFLNNSNIPDPLANPNKTIRYIATVTDTLGCPKPVYDTVTVQVQRVFADAGPRDTIVVLNQPLQLNATGGKFYLWSPATGLSATDIANPVAKINGDIDYMVRVSNETGCFDTDTISVKLYSVTAGLYVPNAFTPNGDGLNDVFIPIALGMKQINYFRIYNRWGQLMYSTSEINKGWDGTFKGKPQQAGVFVWIVDGVDYKDSKVSQKGIVTLIR